GGRGTDGRAGHPRDRARPGRGGTGTLVWWAGVVGAGGGAVDRVFVSGAGDAAGRVAGCAVADAGVGIWLLGGVPDRNPGAAATVYRDDTDGGHSGADTAGFTDAGDGAA